MNPKERVMMYVNQIWELEEDYDDGLTVEDFPLLPGGTKVIDADGWVLYHYDFVRDAIVEETSSGERNRIPWFTVNGADPGGYYPGGL